MHVYKFPVSAFNIACQELRTRNRFRRLPYLENMGFISVSPSKYLAGLATEAQDGTITSSNVATKRCRLHTHFTETTAVPTRFWTLQVKAGYFSEDKR